MIRRLTPRRSGSWREIHHSGRRRGPLHQKTMPRNRSRHARNVRDRCHWRLGRRTSSQIWEVGGRRHRSLHRKTPPSDRQERGLYYESTSRPYFAEFPRPLELEPRATGGCQSLGLEPCGNFPAGTGFAGVRAGDHVYFLGGVNAVYGGRRVFTAVLDRGTKAWSTGQEQLRLARTGLERPSTSRWGTAIPASEQPTPEEELLIPPEGDTLGNKGPEHNMLRIAEPLHEGYGRKPRIE